MKLIQKVQLFKQPAPSIYVTFNDNDALTFLEIEFNELAKYVELQAQQIAALELYQGIVTGNGPYPGNPQLDAQDWPFISWEATADPGGLPAGVAALVEVVTLGGDTPTKLSTAIYNCTPAALPSFGFNCFTIAPSFFTVLLPVRGGSRFEDDYAISSANLSQVTCLAIGQTQIDPDPLYYWVVIVSTLEPLAGSGSTVIFTAQAYTLSLLIRNNDVKVLTMLTPYGDSVTLGASATAVLRFRTDNSALLLSAADVVGGPAVPYVPAINLKKGVTSYDPTLLNSGQLWDLTALDGWDGLPTGPDELVIEAPAP